MTFISILSLDGAARTFLDGIAESDSACCGTCYRSVVCLSVCMSSAIVLRCAKAVGRNEMPFGRDTRVVPSNTVLRQRPLSPQAAGREVWGMGSWEPTVRSDAARCQITLALVVYC